MVQKVKFLSISSFPFIKPADCFNALTEASFALKKGIKYKIDLTRSLVTEINFNGIVLLNVTKKKLNYSLTKMCNACIDVLAEVGAATSL